MRHLAEHVVEGLLGHAPVLGLSGGQPAVEVERGELGIVVEHLLEVRHQPLSVHRVAMEAAAELVVHAAAGHPGQGVAQHLERARIAGPLPDAQDRLPGHRLRELGRLAEPAVALVELAGEAQVGAHQDIFREHAGRAGEALGLLHALHELAPGFQHLAAPSVIGVRDGLEQPREGGHAVTVHRREVGAAVERHAVGGEEHGHRPAAPARHGLHRLHVDLVHVGPLLAIHLDRTRRAGS